MTVLYRLFFFASLIVLFVEPASAGVQFTECAFRTGRSASIIIPKDAPKVDGQPLAPGSEIAVFNQDGLCAGVVVWEDRKSTRLNSSHVAISYAVFCLKKELKMSVTRVEESRKQSVIIIITASIAI